jgi:Pvc16 N-terminal domain
MPNLHAVHSVGHSLVTWLKNSYPAEIREMTDCEFLLLSSGEMAAKEERGPALSLWLYRVAWNEHLRHAGRRGDGPQARTPMFLDLHFLLTAWADNALAEHTLLTWAMQRLHEQPVLDLSTLSPEGGWAPGDQVQMIPVELSNEDLMRIWDTLEPAYRLSVPYVARVVRVDPDGAAPDALRVVATRFTFEPPKEGAR